MMNEGSEVAFGKEADKMSSGEVESISDRATWKMRNLLLLNRNRVSRFHLLIVEKNTSVVISSHLYFFQLMQFNFIV